MKAVIGDLFTRPNYYILIISEKFVLRFYDKVNYLHKRNQPHLTKKEIKSKGWKDANG